ncbi:T9SS type A sorting domain-containing protein [Hymenobacter properus]|uniref:T9SS type A sorting domain-containing protein n=1 Tax=Hymenobacter properus TaxID=2791026 RepID=A0A931FK41_9BACT|nr:T9SS type A sorting domain-containing protein [Hymenobacter properus]MBF9141285.1 T9SS type A sorting domain-containing protein [Hymenobacter properus]MBR7720095.1 T9SS type A sorting domain-containing protein [Microvirga sp. SRT04]
MKKFTLHLRTAVCLGLLAAPGLARAQAPMWQWAAAPSAIVDNNTGFGGSSISAVAQDAFGNTVVAGSFYGSFTLGNTTLTSAGYNDIFVAKVSPTGQWLQAVRAGGPGQDGAATLELDAAGNAVVGGSFGGLVPGATAAFGPNTLITAGNADAFVATLSTTGQWTQAVRAGGTGTDYVADMVPDGTGNMLVVGTITGVGNLGNSAFNGPAGAMQLFVARLNLGTGTWTLLSQGTPPYGAQPSALALNAAGNAVVAGRCGSNITFGSTTLTSNRNEGTFVARLNTSTGQWTQAVAPVQSRSNSAPPSVINSLAVDAAGTVAVTGVLIETATFGNLALTSAGSYDVFVAKLNTAGQWTQAVRAGGAANDIPYSVIFDTAGNAIVTGLFGPYGGFSPTLSADFGSNTVTSAGQYDAFVATLSPSGQWLQAVRGGGGGSDIAGPTVVDAAGNITVAGSCTGPATFGPHTLNTNSGYGMAYVARLSTDLLVTHATTPATGVAFALAPNPATGAVHLTWPEASEAARQVQLLDAVGREVRRQVLPAHVTTATLDVAGLTKGLYVVRCGAATSRLQVD